MLLFPSKRQLRERRLVAWRVFNVNEVLVIWDAVIFWQLKQTNEGLEQRGPEQRDESVRTQDMTVEQFMQAAMFKAVFMQHHKQQNQWILKDFSTLKYLYWYYYTQEHKNILMLKWQIIVIVK